jgi:hypothetical protein
MEPSRRLIPIVMLAGTGLVAVTNASFDNAGDQSEVTQGTLTAASAQGAVYFPSPFMLYAVSEHIPAF